MMKSGYWKTNIKKFLLMSVDDDNVYQRLEEAGSFNRTKAKTEDS